VSGQFSRPYVISWNLTYRCNLACEHCYLDAGAKKFQILDSDNFSDRSELNTEQCFQVIDQIKEFAPESLTILTGGEPLLRKDILEIIRYAAIQELWVVVGTNGVLITESLAQTLAKTGVRGMALSLDALDAERHDKFRMVKGAWENTVEGAKVLHKQALSFIIQTTVGKHNAEELESIANFAYRELGATVWNLYFLVQTGRGQFVSDLTQADYQRVLLKLHEIQTQYKGKMVVNAKCAPHYVTTLLKVDSTSPFLKSYTDGAGGCPAGTHYMGIRPNGDVTPCPYLPQFGGNLKNSKLESIWRTSDLFTSIRERNKLGGRCGACECNSLCGGCRARAYGVTGDYLAEDPLCDHQPGALQEQLLKIGATPQLSYGENYSPQIEWEAAASERMLKVPKFVRGMVIRKVEAYCREQGVQRVTLSELESIRARMPTAKLFSKTGEIKGEDEKIRRA